MAFVPVDPDKTGLKKEVAQEYRLQKLADGTISLPTKKLLVVDPSKLNWPDDPVTVLRMGLVGEIEYPLDFCPMDSGACTQGGDLDGFYRHGGIDAAGEMHPEVWIHSCYRPTRKYFTNHVKSVVKFFTDVPW